VGSKLAEFALGSRARDDTGDSSKRHEKNENNYAFHVAASEGVKIDTRLFNDAGWKIVSP